MGNGLSRDFFFYRSSIVIKGGGGRILAQLFFLSYSNAVVSFRASKQYFRHIQDEKSL
jgi:hypothetical protein